LKEGHSESEWEEELNGGEECVSRAFVPQDTAAAGYSNNERQNQAKLVKKTKHSSLME